MSKKAARPANPQRLARAIVDARWSQLDNWFDMLHPGESDCDGDEQWRALRAAVLADVHPEVTAEHLEELNESLDDSKEDGTWNTNWKVEESSAAAGFLLGLELGRRIGGAR